MTEPGQAFRKHPRNVALYALSAVFGLVGACHQSGSEKAPDAHAVSSVVASASSNAAPAKSTIPPLVTLSERQVPPGIPIVSPTQSGPQKVDFEQTAMGTNVHFIAYTNEQVNAEQIRAAMGRALAEMKRLELILSEWRSDSEVGKVNASPEQWVKVGPETLAVITRGLDEGKASKGAFDITFQAMSGLWKFGSAAEDEPKVPPKADIERLRKLVDYRKVEVDTAQQAVKLGKDQKIGLGGIAKGYIVDRAAAVMKQAGLSAFLVQAGGDLYGAGRKPDGSAWISGIQDPRALEGVYFATIELTDHAFSTAGDYARSYVIDKRRYHHIIDPKTGYPATASRSVTVWAEDATTADAIDDSVFILGPEQGMKLAEQTPGVGVVIVDKNNKVWVSPRLAGKVHITRQPTDGI